MNRLLLLTGGTVLALLLIGVGHQYQNTEVSSGPQGRVPVTARITLPGPEVVPAPATLTKAEKIQQLLEVMRSTNDYKVVGEAAVALQNFHDPALFEPILTRLDEIGVLDNPGKLPWFSKVLLKKYLETAPNQTLAQRAIKTRPALGDPQLAQGERLQP